LKPSREARRDLSAALFFGLKKISKTITLVHTFPNPAARRYMNLA